MEEKVLRNFKKRNWGRRKTGLICFWRGRGGERISETAV